MYRDILHVVMLIPFLAYIASSLRVNDTLVSRIPFLLSNKHMIMLYNLTKIADDVLGQHRC